MAITGLTDLEGYNDVFFAAWVPDMILDEERPYAVMTKDMFWFYSNQQSPALDFPIQADPGAAATFGGEETGNDGTSTELTTDKFTATLATVGMMTTITKELTMASRIPVLRQAAQVLGRSCMEKFQTDMTAFLDDFSNTTGTAGVATSYATLLEAANQLAQRDQVGEKVGVLDPVQWGNVQQDLGTQGAAALSRSDIAVGQALDTKLEGYAGHLAGTDWYQTSLVTSTGGAVFVKGVALGLYEGWDTTTDSFYDISAIATEIVSSKRYAAVETRDRAGETILI